MPEGEKRKREDEGASKVWVEQNTDFSQLGEEGASLQAEKEGKEIGGSQVRAR